MAAARVFYVVQNKLSKVVNSNPESVLSHEFFSPRIVRKIGHDSFLTHLTLPH